MNIGIEIELPVVDREGNAASYESVRNLFKSWRSTTILNRTSIASLPN